MVSSVVKLTSTNKVHVMKLILIKLNLSIQKTLETNEKLSF